MPTTPDGTPSRAGPPFVRHAAIGAAVVLALAGCARSSPPSGSDTTASRRGGGSGAIPVVAVPVVTQAMPLALDAIGVVEPLRTVAIRSLVAGTLVRVGFQEGSDVHRGDVLFEIDPRPYRNAVRSAEADLEKTGVQLKMAEAQVARYTALTTGGMVTREQLDTLENTAQTLRAARAASEAALASARLQLEFCSIRSPCDGRTGALGAHEGDLVRASDTAVTLVTVTQLSPIYVSFTLPQQDLATLQRYQAAGLIPVTATPSGSGATGDRGTVSFIDSAVDAATGTIRLKATFANTARTLWPGQFARVSVQLASLPDQVVVPTPAVQPGQRGTQVYVVRPDHTAELRRVTVDRTVGASTVIARGLSPGELVVIDGHVRLRANAVVSLQPPVEDQPARRDAGPRRVTTGERAGGAGGVADSAEGAR